MNDVVITSPDETQAPIDSGMAKRCTALKDLLEGYDQLQRKTLIRDTYIDIASKLRKVGERLHQQTASYMLLLQIQRLDGDGAILHAMDSKSVSRVRSLLGQFRQAFVEQKENVPQSEQQEWPNLLDGMASLTKELQQHIEPVWSSYIEDLRRGWQVDESLLHGQMLIKERKQVFDAYQVERARFIDAVRQAPGSQAELDAVHQLQQRLETLRSKMDLDVPPAVNRFLMASGRRGASLDLLTEEVLAWLETNDDITRYRITRHQGN
ncbi:hypothetical protein Fbal_3240 [Ferrimonas balearica DSM 9799]|uniref:Uncharacterized protein n=1 Tax=Ferrimonas balearica (strain DSM 9799 / CCM 4581 / KCTC 23876 / PAT) TaxID=550540 RepID=E1SVY8_FERBD|nr:hypothetical protein [Ferrimonas balearica]ADN77439.1 hypothetical protein Fbal_3240 [Ferrimonas balearica DSM 9799]